MTDAPSAFAPVRLASPDNARAAVCAYGAHTTSWIDASGDERLFLSTRSAFRAGAAIRGGIPVVFPQFADLGPLSKHGFARTAEWTLLGAGADAPHDVPGEARATAVFELRDSTATRALWPHPFVARLTVHVADDALDVELAVRNTGETDMSFTAALHSYFRVVDLAAVRVRGLEGVRYRDKTAGGREVVERARELAIAGEVDRVYFDVAGPVELIEPGRGTRVERTGFPDVVVWNPGPALTATLPDMEPNGYRSMVCVESAAVRSPIVLDPDATWTGRQVARPLAAR